MEYGSFPRRTFNLNLSVMNFHDFLAKGKAEAGPFRFFGEKRIEDIAKIFLVDTGAVVFHRYLEKIPVFEPAADDDGAALVFQRLIGVIDNVI